MKNIFTIIVLIMSINVFAQVPSYIPTDGLVGYWPFDGNANDESFTEFPLATVSQIVSITISTNSADSVRDNPTF